MYSKFCRITVSNNSNLEICYKPMIIDDFCDSYGIIYIYGVDDFIHTFKFSLNFALFSLKIFG